MLFTAVRKNRMPGAGGDCERLGPPLRRARFADLRRFCPSCPEPLLAGALVAIASCRAQRSGPADAGAELPWSNEPAWPGLTLDLTPAPSQDELRVEIRLSGELAARVTELTAARRWADTRG